MSENNNSIYNKALIFTVVALVVILVGTIVTVFVPMMTTAMHPKLENVPNNPYTPLQLAGRDVYQKEGCINCHSQTVRPLKADVLRYGEISQPGESAYERPFLWGSKRTGPDLARVGGLYSDEWQKAHLLNPQHFFPKSNMPKYPWLAEKKLDPVEIEKHAKLLGLTYTQEDIDALKDATELDAIVAYLQQLGTYVQNTHAVLADETAFVNWLCDIFIKDLVPSVYTIIISVVLCSFPSDDKTITLKQYWVFSAKSSIYVKLVKLSVYL